MTVKDLSINDRPYEKFLTRGPEFLSDSELLALILNSGTKGKSVLEICKEIMTKDKENIGLTFLAQYSANELMKINGIGQKRAVLIKALCEFAKRYKLAAPRTGERINTPQKLSRIFMIDLMDETQEVVKTAILDTKNRVIKVVTNSIGNINSNTITMKDILSEPIKLKAPNIAICHNHPSGDINPSKADISFTNQLNDACKIFGINLIDHIIIRW